MTAFQVPEGVFTSVAIGASVQFQCF